jgi:hypothetical protein
MTNFRNVMMFKRPDFGATIGNAGEAAKLARRRRGQRGQRDRRRG